jgi:hypothetical protein
MTSIWTLHRWWPAIAAALVLPGCGGSSHKSTARPTTVTVTTPAHTSPPPLTELLSVPAVGRIYGRCKPGDPRWTIKTTAPLSLDISQGTEPHIFRVHIAFAVAAAIGDTTDCALIASSMNATTYYPGGQPPS